MKQKSKADSFYDIIKDDPQEIINWAKREITEYKNLIKLIRKKGVKK